MIPMDKHILAAFIAAFFLLKTTKGEQVYNLSKGLLNSNVNQVIQVDNDLWLATSRGVSQIINWQNPNTGGKQIANRATSVAVNAICKYEGDFLWVSTNIFYQTRKIIFSVFQLYLLFLLTILFLNLF